MKTRFYEKYTNIGSSKLAEKVANWNVANQPTKVYYIICWNFKKKKMRSWKVDALLLYSYIFANFLSSRALNRSKLLLVHAQTNFYVFYFDINIILKIFLIICAWTTFFPKDCYRLLKYDNPWIVHNLKHITVKVSSFVRNTGKRMNSIK